MDHHAHAKFGDNISKGLRHDLLFIITKLIKRLITTASVSGKFPGHKDGTTYWKPHGCSFRKLICNIFVMKSIPCYILRNLFHIN